MSYVKLEQETGGSLPTNSWLQNCIVDTQTNQERYFYSIPWYYTFSSGYGDLTNFTVGHSGYMSTTNTITQGNLLQIENGANFSIGTSDRFELTRVDDLTASFVSKTIKLYVTRGSPYVTILYDNSNVSITPLGQISSLVSIKEGLWKVGLSAPIVTICNFDIITVDGKTSSQGFYVAGTEAIELENCRASLEIVSTTTRNTTVVQSYRVTLMVAAVIYIVEVDISSGNIYVREGDKSLVFSIVGSNQQLQAVQASTGRSWLSYFDSVNWRVMYSVPSETEWYIYGPKNLINNGGVLTTNEEYTGLVQISEAKEPLQSGFGSYPTQSIAYDFKPNGSYAVTFGSSSSSFLMYLPDHWFSYNLSGVKKLEQKLNTIMYGDLTLCEMASNVKLDTNFAVPTGIVPLSSKGQQSNLMKQIEADLTDCQRRFSQWNSAAYQGPYQCGTSIGGGVARLLLLADSLSLKTDIVNTTIENTKTVAVNWLTNANLFRDNDPPLPPRPVGGIPFDEVFYIKREETWKGLICPADYYHDKDSQYYRAGNYNNSYYADHHFHWGYFFYMLATLYKVGDDAIIGELDKQKLKIEELLRDVCNPTSSQFGWKTRHKDWYSGHSWATGLTNEAERQEESCAEAINCYYGAYLLASHLELQDIAACAAVCLNLEIKACRSYWFLQAPGTKKGLMEWTNCVGMLKNRAKECTLDWPPIPNDYNGRMLGITGIQVLPFTEITPLQLDSNWIDSLATTPVVNGNRPYSLDIKLVSQLCEFDEANPGATAYRPQLGLNELAFPPPPHTIPGDPIWAVVGLKLLCFGSGNQTELNNSWISVKNKIDYYQNNLITLQDSLSNTYYWLCLTEKARFSNNNLVIGNKPSGIVNVDLPCAPNPAINCDTILELSEAREYGLVHIPVLYINVCLKDYATPKAAFIQVVDNEPHNNRERARKIRGCIKETTLPANVYITGFRTNIDPTSMVLGVGNLVERATFNKVKAGSLIGYAFLRLALCRLLYGKFDLKYLRRSFTSKFTKDLASTRYCNFVQAFASPEFSGCEQAFIY
jgi:endoglucanase Acf2